MAIHKLDIDDFEEDDSFILIAIHCSMEDYRLAYILNENLNLKLQRKSMDLDFSKASYSIFEWEDENELLTWNLVSNSCKVEEEISNNSTSLFNNQNQVITIYNLVPEYKAANYFLKIHYQTDFIKEKTILNTILSIPQIVTAYSVQPEKLKTKTNLIFN